MTSPPADQTPEIIGALQGQLQACEELLADAWVKIPIRWSKVDVGRIIVDDRARLWLVLVIASPVNWKVGDRALDVTVEQIGKGKRYVREVHPDAVVNVLVPAAERDAMLLLRAELGAQLAEPERG